MPKDFDFHMLVIDVMFKSWQTQQQQLILTKLHSYEVWVNTFFPKLQYLSIHQIFNSSDPVYLK